MGLEERVNQLDSKVQTLETQVAFYTNRIQKYSEAMKKIIDTLTEEHVVLKKTVEQLLSENEE